MLLETHETPHVTDGTYTKLPNIHQPIHIVKNVDKSGALWSILAILHPLKTNQDSTSRYKQHFDKFNIEGIDFSGGFINENMSELESINVSNLIVFELKVINGKPKNLPLYICESEHDNSIDQIWYKKNYV